MLYLRAQMKFCLILHIFHKTWKKFVRVVIRVNVSNYEFCENRHTKIHTLHHHHHHHHHVPEGLGVFPVP